MQCATRVHVISADGKRIASVPGPVAQKQIGYGNAYQVGTGSTVRAIRLYESTPRTTGPCREVTVSSYMGTSYTRRAAICNAIGEVIGFQHELNRINPADAALFNIAVKESIVDRAA